MGRPATAAPMFAAVLIFFIFLATGMHAIEQDRGQVWDWVPAGGRFERQLKEWDQYVDKSVTDRTYLYIQIRSENEDENLLDDPAKWLNLLERTARSVYGYPMDAADAGFTASITVTDANGDEHSLDWKDFCFSINHPLLTGEIPGISNGTGTNLKPCIQPSPLDAFSEQGWEFSQSSSEEYIREKYDSFNVINDIAVLVCTTGIALQGCGQTNDPSNYPSFRSLTRQQIIDRLKALGNNLDVGHWISAASQPWGKLYGSFEGYNNGCATSPPPPSSAPSSLDLSGCDFDLTKVTSFLMTVYQDIPTEVVQFRRTVLNLTSEEFLEANEKWLKEVGHSVEKLDERTDGDWKDAKITYYPSDALDRMYGELSDASTPTIVIGYCCMLAFVLLTQIPWGGCESHLNFTLLGFCGFFLILVANAAAYGLVAWVLAFKFNMTMLQALPFLALGLGVDDLFLMLHAFRDAMMHYKGAPPADILAEVFREAGASITITSWCNTVVFFGCAGIIPIRALQALLLSAGFIVFFNWVCAMALIPPVLALWANLYRDGQTTIADANKKFAAAQSSSPAALGLAGRMYTAFAESMVMKVCGFLIGLAILVGFSVLIPKVEMGYEEADLARRGSALGDGITEMYKHIYSQHSTENIVFGIGVDLEKDQEQMLRTFDELANSEWSAFNTAFGRSGSSAAHWLRNMYGADAVTPWRGWYGNQTCDPDLAYDPNDNCAYTPDPAFAVTYDLHLWRYPQTFLLPRSPGTIAFGGLLAGLLDRANSWVYQLPPADDAMGVGYYGPDNKLLLSWDEIELQMHMIKKTKDKLEMIKYFKKTLEDSGLNIYMYSWLFIQMEQFVSLEYYFWQAASVSMAAVFVVCLLLGLSWAGAATVALFSIFVALEVYGALYVFDISYQSFSTVSMLTSIGIAVEFTAHPIAAFEFASGTRNQRLATAMQRTAAPVFFGAVSSFFGFAFLAASDFLFVVKYFFTIFLMICVFGAINGLVFLPAILGLFYPCSTAPAGKTMPASIPSSDVSMEAVNRASVSAS